jgi:hypothetical protein
MLWLGANEEATMTVKIPLRLRGLDLRESEAYDRIDSDLTDLSWEANGGVSLAVFYGDGPSSSAIDEAADWARRIAKLLPGVEVAEVYDELVSTADIAVRAGVAAEAVRLWAAGKRRVSIRPFPAPRQVVGSGPSGKTMSLYAWREVLSWIREVIGIDPDEGIEYLNDLQYATLNAELPANRTDPAWRILDVETEQIIADVQHLCAKDGGAASIVVSYTRASNEGMPSGYLPMRRTACH